MPNKEKKCHIKCQRKIQLVLMIKIGINYNGLKKDNLLQR